MLATVCVALLAGSPVYAAPSPNAAKPCEAYLYYGSKINLCDQFPGSADRDCTNIQYRVTLRNNSVDPWDLDGLKGGDRGVIGLGCESYPVRRVTPSPTPGPKGETETPPTSDPEVETETLPKTGPAAPALFGAGAVLFLGGMTGIWVARRRRDRFEA